MPKRRAPRKVRVQKLSYYLGVSFLTWLTAFLRLSASDKPKRAPSAYQKYVGEQIKIWRAENPDRDHREAMKAVCCYARSVIASYSHTFRSLLSGAKLLRILIAVLTQSSANPKRRLSLRRRRPRKKTTQVALKAATTESSYVFYPRGISSCLYA